MFGLLSISSGNAENLIVNGSFENPIITGNELNFSGAFSIPGWSGYSTGNGTTSSSGIINATVGPPPLDGSQDFSFNGGNPPAGSYIEQSFATTEYQQYSLTFSLYRFNDQTSAVQLNAGLIDPSANTILNLTAVPQANAGWTTFTEQFTSDAASLTLKFTDTSPSNPNTDLIIDAVSIVAVPEPSSWALILTALCSLIYLGVGLYAHRKKKGENGTGTF
jgi:hypothetical protein